MHHWELLARKILGIVKDLLNYGCTVCILEDQAVIYSPYLQYMLKKLFSFVSLKVFVTRLYLFACIMWVYASVPVLTGVMVTFYVLLKFFDSFVWGCCY